MVSPDVTPYVDLRIYDRDPQELFEAALVNLRAYLPEWEPREGNTEVLLLECFALLVSEGVIAINRVPGAVVEILLRLYGVERDLGAPPQTAFEFELIDSNGYTLPAGARVALPVNGGEDTLVFITDAAVVAVAGTTVVSVTATADINTTIANGVQPGAPVELLDSISFVERVDMSLAVFGGADVEDDTSWFTRGIQRFARLSETLTLPRHFNAAALERPEVVRAFTIDNFDGTATNPGHVSVAVYGASGVLTAAQKTAMQIDFDLAAQANLAVHIIDPTLQLVNVTTTVVALPGYMAAVVMANVDAALRAYLSADTWSYAGTVYKNELISLIDRVEGVDRVVSVTVPAGDLALSGVAPLAVAGQVLVTVQ